MMEKNIKITILISIGLIIALAIIFLLISGYLNLGNPKTNQSNTNVISNNSTSSNITEAENLKEKVEGLILSNTIIKEDIDSKNYSIGNITIAGINDTDWHFKTGYLNNNKYYKVPISIDDGSIMGKSILSIADINSSTVPCIDYYGANVYRLIPMTGQTIIPPNSYWYHEIGGSSEILLTITVLNTTSKYDSMLISGQSLLNLMNTPKNITLQPDNITQINYNVSYINGSSYYKVNATNEDQREIYLLIKNNNVDNALSINYEIGPIF